MKEHPDFKPLSNLRQYLLLAGAVLMCFSAVCYAFLFLTKIVCWTFFAGSVLFMLSQSAQVYIGINPTIIRLKNIQVLSEMFFLIAGILMIDSAYQIFRPFFDDYLTYFRYVYNKWVLFLLLGGIFRLYATFRIDAEIKKQSRKK